jgi:hypothetical protein
MYVVVDVRKERHSQPPVPTTLHDLAENKVSPGPEPSSFN